jgi:hypothetical protein
MTEARQPIAFAMEVSIYQKLWNDGCVERRRQRNALRGRA